MSDDVLGEFKGQLTEYRRLGAIRDAAKLAIDEADEDLRRFRFKLHEDMEEAGVGSTKISVPIFDGNGMDTGEVEMINFIPTSSDFAAIQDRDALIEWVKENPEERGKYIGLKEEKAALNQLVAESLKKGTPLPPGVGFYTTPKVGQRRS